MQLAGVKWTFFPCWRTRCSITLELIGSNRTKRDLARLHHLAGRMFSEISKAFIQLIIKQTGCETQERSMLTIILICLLWIELMTCQVRKMQ